MFVRSDSGAQTALGNYKYFPIQYYVLYNYMY